MDIDKPLDDLISNNKQGGGRRQDNRSDRPRPGRQSSDRTSARAAAPYARPPPRSTEDKWVHDMGPRGGNAGGGRGGPFRGAAGNAEGGIPSLGPPIFTGVSPRILVTGIHYEVTAQDLKNIFSQAGTLVQGPTIRYDRSGRSIGEASMEYSSYQEAKIAINKYDGAMTKGQTISIRLLPPARRGPPAGAEGAAAGAGAGAGRRGAAGAAAQTGESLLARMSNGGGKASGGGGAAQGGNGRAQARGSPRENAPRARAAPAGGRGGGAGGRGGRRGPANATDLDKELESFMSADKTTEDVKMD